ncbi:JAB domain-containing protein [Algoriphagus sp. NF]|uniref:JAB domain-containing protein n=1 Tax=Algoriphagus sp. NF TaxID=2992756 RepID=UPI00237AEC74|nr:JAB domain-containing protein [Algoriphagus sp. NF]MDE0561756.1 JAB domain-containing protein [Algoriphagus sp. NF]
MNQTISEINISYKPIQQNRRLGTIRRSSDAYKVLKELYNQDLINAREEFIILYLNQGGKVLGYFKAFTGGISSVTCDLKIILGVGLKSLATSVILSHNHPSGNLKPSSSDLNLTKRVAEGCKVMDIHLFDHLILSDEGYFSFADEGLLNETG